MSMILRAIIDNFAVSEFPAVTVATSGLFNHIAPRRLGQHSDLYARPEIASGEAEVEERLLFEQPPCVDRDENHTAKFIHVFSALVLLRAPTTVFIERIALLLRRGVKEISQYTDELIPLLEQRCPYLAHFSLAIPILDSNITTKSLPLPRCPRIRHLLLHTGRCLATSHSTLAFIADNFPELHSLSLSQFFLVGQSQVDSEFKYISNASMLLLAQRCRKLKYLRLGSLDNLGHFSTETTESLRSRGEDCFLNHLTDELVVLSVRCVHTAPAVVDAFPAFLQRSKCLSALLLAATEVRAGFFGTAAVSSVELLNLNLCTVGDLGFLRAQFPNLRALLLKSANLSSQKQDLEKQLVAANFAPFLTQLDLLNVTGGALEIPANSNDDEDNRSGALVVNAPASLEFLAHLPSLKALRLGHCCAVDVAPLRHCENLQRLSLSGRSSVNLERWTPPPSLRILIFTVPPISVEKLLAFLSNAASNNKNGGLETLVATLSVAGNGGDADDMCCRVLRALEQNSWVSQSLKKLALTFSVAFHQPVADKKLRQTTLTTKLQHLNRLMLK